MVDLSGADISGKTPGFGAAGASTGEVTSSRTYDFVGIGGGGGGGSWNGAGGAGTAGLLNVSGVGVTLTVNNSILVGGAGGGAGGFGVGGAGGAGTLTIINGGALAVSETLLIGGSAGGGGWNGGAVGGSGGVGTVSVDAASSIAIGSGGSLVIGGANGQSGTTTAGGLGGSGTLNLSGSLTFGSGASFVINAGSTLNIGGATPGASTAGPIAGLTSLTNDGTINFNQSNGSYTFAANISGTGHVNQAGTGVTILSGTNTYSSGTTVTGGLINFSDVNNFGSNNITLNGGGLQWATGNTTDISNKLNAIGAGGAVFDTNGNDVTFATALSDGGSGGGITKQGAGSLTLSGFNSYGGPTTINAGRLAVEGGLALPDTTQVTVASGATLEIIDIEAIGSLAGSGNVTIDSAALLSVGLADPTVSTTFAGAITGGGLTLDGGSLTLTGASTIDGLAICDCGHLTITGAGASVVDVGDPLFSPGVIVEGTLNVLAGATLQASALLFAGNMTVNGAGSSVTVEGPTEISTMFADSRLTISGGATMTSNAGAAIAGFATVGPFTPTATVTGSGSTWVVAGGPLLIGKTDCGCGDELGVLTITAGGAVTAAAVEISSLGVLNLGTGGTAGTLTVPTIANAGEVVANFDLTQSLTLAANISGTGTLSKAGSGVLTLSGTSAYIGATTVTGGTLLVEGSLGNTAVSVGSGAVLGGSGSIAGAVTIANGGVLAPGSSPGTLTVGSLTLNPTSQLDYQLGTPGVVGAGVNDLVNLTNSLALNGVLNIDPQAGFGTGAYTLITYGSMSSNGGLQLGAVPAGYAFTVSTSTPGQVNLLTTYNSLQFWNGSVTTPNGIVNGGSGIWGTTTTNWTNQIGTAAYAGPILTAVFAGPAGGTVTLVSNQQVEGLQFATGGYTLQGPGALVVINPTEVRIDPSLSATIAASIAGAGGLVKTGAGTIVLSGNNSYAGGTTINAGVLSVSSDANLGAASGGLTFNGGTLATTASFTTSRSVTLNGTGALAVAGGTTLTAGGTISGPGGLAQTGPGTLILTGANSYAGGTTVSSGMLVLGSSTAAGTGAVSLSGGTALGFASGISVANALVLGGNVTFDLASGSAIASGSLSGSGNIAYTGGGLLTLTGDSSAFAGTTSVTGTLSVNGTLGGSVNVLSGGTLKGNGTVGATTIASGGTIAPGNSIGTLTVNGPLTFASGSTYAVEINPQGQSDRIAVTGSATLNGATVSVTKAPGSYLPGTSYTILTAQGGVAGTFGPLTQDLPFINLALSYAPTDVTLNVVRNQVSFPNVAVTANQVATAGAVEALGQGNALYNAVVSQTSVAGAQQAFNALDGEVYPSALSIFQNESLILRRAVLDRARVPVAAPANAPLAYAAKAAAGPFSAGSDVVELPGTPNAFWAQGFGAWGQIDGNGNAATISGNTSGVFVGYDRTFSPGLGDWRLGFAAGYSASSYQVDARSSSFSSDNAHVAVYGGTSFGSLGLRFGGAYSWADISADRSMVFPGFFNALSANTSARTGQVFGEVGYGLSFAQVNVEPFAGLAYVNVDMSDFTEIGGPAALTSSGASEGVTYSTLGARISVPFALGTIPTAFKGTLAWQHAFGDTTPETLFAFGPGTAPFTVSGVPTANDAALIEAGLDMAFSANASLSIFYAGQLAETDTSNMVKGSFTLRF
ncbi:autotransporter domain-containing protein [Aquabacter sp. CN5-332]|uniref:autotransporter domain-containing protein n=1 Tax=Aquabacter sp. CN5-332 TaxID=3156608 RepID=UPI0032B3243F